MTEFAADPAVPLQRSLPATLLEFLYNRINYERTSTVPYSATGFKLERMRQLLRQLGDPQDHLKVVHVAGTKGKGSTATMIARVLGTAGYCTGLYTSPHLERLEERFVVDNVFCTADELMELVAQVREVVEGMDRDAAEAGDESRGPTYFEITTAMAMLYFRAKAVDLAVLEVGLGGRLDSTNVCHPLVCVITSISFDHTKQLGSTLAAIAGEKAGIIKPGVPVVTAVTQDEPFEVIQKVAAHNGCAIHCLGRDFWYELEPAPALLETAPAGVRFSYREVPGGPLGQLDGLGLQLLGQHQAGNAATALRTLGVLRQAGWKIPDAALREGLAGVYCPARIEVVRDHPAIILDAAHNVASVEALMAALETHFSGRSGRRILVFASSRDKDTAGMLRVLLPRFDRIVLTRYLENPRGLAPAELESLAQTIATQQRITRRPPELMVCAEPAAAWQQAAADLQPQDLLCITGSFYIAAEMRRFMQPVTEEVPS